MKHMTRITQQGPEKAAAWQDNLCFIATALVGLLGFLGGEAPGVSFVEDKCFIPQPNDETSGN